MAATKRSDGTIRRRGDAWQVSLFTGYDPLNGRRMYLTSTAPSEAASRKALNKLRSQRDEQLAPKTRAELSFALTEWLGVQELAAATRHSYGTYIRVHIEPGLGSTPIARLGPRFSNASTPT
jgi:integrase